MLFSFKKICIESPTPTTQAGHISQTYLLDEYHDHLYARVAGFKENGTWLIHVSLDLLSFDMKKWKKLQARIREAYGDDNIKVISSSTHTHYANKPDDEKYEPWLLDTLVEGITSMEYAEYEDVQTTYRYVPCQVVGKSRISGYETNNEFLCLLSFYSKGKNFFNWIIHNCHPTILKAETHFFSAEFPGFLLKKLEDNYDADFTYCSGAQGDISSRFVRDDQTYASVEKLGTNLFNEVKKLMEDEDKTYVPFKLEYKAVPFTYRHSFTPLDLSNIRSDLSQRELETIEFGKIMRERLKKRVEDNGLENSVITDMNVVKVDFGSISFVFFPNEIFSEYLNEFDLDKKMLVSYSNGYGPYVLPIGFPYVTYEMFTDTITDDCKRELIEIFRTI